MVNKRYIRTPKPDEQIKVEPSVAMVKDLLEENIDGHVIYLCEEDARIAKPDKKDKHRPVVGMPVGERSNFKKIPTHTQDLSW